MSPRARGGPGVTAGWYRDPSDPTRLRHWNGTDWDTRRRNLPGWAIAAIEVSAFDVETGESVPDGPVPDGPVHDGPVHDGPVRHGPVGGETVHGGPGHSAALPAASPAPGSTRAHRLTSGRRSSQRGRWLPPSADWPAPANRVPRGHRWTRTRSPAVVAFGLVGVVILTLAGALISSARTPQRLAALSSDTAFARAANAACATAMGAIRIGTSATISPEGAPTGPSVATVTASNRALATLATNLEAAAAGPRVREEIAGWLANWTTYAHDRHQSASLLAAHPHPTGTVLTRATLLGSAESATAVRADGFAVDNGLRNCTLVPRHGSSVETIP